MANNNLTEWKTQKSKYHTVRLYASLIVQKIPSLRDEMTKASSAFENIVISNGESYDNGEMVEHNEKMKIALDCFQSLVNECDIQIEELKSKIDAEEAKLQAKAAKKANAANNNTQTAGSGVAVKSNRYSDPQMLQY